jgi:hypothetical protein
MFRRNDGILSPEDGYSVLPRSVGIYLRDYTAPKPRGTSSLNSPVSEKIHILAEIKTNLKI